MIREKSIVNYKWKQIQVIMGKRTGTVTEIVGSGSFFRIFLINFVMNCIRMRLIYENRFRGGVSE